MRGWAASRWAQAIRKISEQTDRRKRCRAAKPAQRGVCAPEPGSQRGQELRGRERSLRRHGVDQRGTAGADERSASRAWAWRTGCPSSLKKPCSWIRFRQDLLAVLRRTSQAGAEHLADRFFRCMRRDECDRMIELVKQLGSPVLAAVARNPANRPATAGLGRSGLGQPPRCGNAAGIAARALAGVEPLLSRHRGAADRLRRGRPIAGALCWNWRKFLDPLVLPEAVDEIGMSGDLTAVPPLIAMARPGEAASRSPLHPAQGH